MTLWSGRLPDPPSRLLWDYTVDRADHRLLTYDIEGSIAHAAMLRHVGLISVEDHEAIYHGLTTMLEEARSGALEIDPADEDVHSAVERNLTERIGEAGLRLHTGRSRNDQVATDLVLYLRDACTNHEASLLGFARTLAARALEHADTVVAAYTHLQQAQAVALGHHLLAHAWPALRDASRFADLRGRLDASPLGAGAVAGSTLPIDPQHTAAGLGFGSVAPNSIDAVGARDLAAEFVWCCTQAMVSRSRLAEDLVLWSSDEFSWVSFPDHLATGSSALPHKKNPDIAEVARGRAAGAIGDLTAILALQKGLPASYHRDLQEDKTHVFRSDDTLGATLAALTGLVAEARFDPPLPSSWVTAIDLAEALVERGVPFREAHRTVAGVVGRLVAEGRTLGDATGADLAAASELFTDADLSLVQVGASPMPRHTNPMTGSASSVRAQVTAIENLV